MVSLTKLQVYPRCLDHRLGFMDQQRVGSRLSCRKRNNRVSVHRCESDLEKKKVERRRKREKEGNGLLDSLKSGVSKLRFLSKDEYNQKVQNLEMVFSSVSLRESNPCVSSLILIKMGLV